MKFYKSFSWLGFGLYPRSKVHATMQEAVKAMHAIISRNGMTGFTVREKATDHAMFEGNGWWCEITPID